MIQSGSHRIPILFVVMSLCCTPRPLLVNAQEASRIVSSRPIIDDYRDALILRETDRFGKYEPADHPEAWAIITDLSPGPDGGVLFVDQRTQYAGLIVPGEGVIVRYGQGEGSGPGEFRGMDSIAWDYDSRIYISDRRNSRVSVFTVEGQYLHDVRTSVLNSLLIAFPDESMWVRPWMNPSVDLLYRFNSDGERLDEIDSQYVDEPWLGLSLSDPALYGTPAGFLIVPSYPYVVYDYSANGEIRKTFEQDTSWLKPPRRVETTNYGSMGTFPTGRVWDVARLSSGVTVVLIEKRSSNGRSDSGLPRYDREYILDVFLPSGEWLTSISAEELTGNPEASLFNVSGSSDNALWVSVRFELDFIVRYEVNLISRNHQ